MPQSTDGPRQAWVLVPSDGTAHSCSAPESILALICLSVPIETGICHPVVFWLPRDV